MEAAAKPKSKKELYAFYAGKGPAAMVLDILEDRDLQKVCIIICKVGGVLETTYRTDLELMKTKENQHFFAAHRATETKPLSMALACLSKIQDDALLARLGMTPPHDGINVAADSNVGWVGKERKLMKCIFSFGSALASEIIWSFCHYRWTLPHALAIYLRPDAAERKRGANHLKRIAYTILKAEQVEQPKAELMACLQDVSWHSEQVSRKILQAGFACDWDPDSRELQDLAKRCWGGSTSTKEILESCFNNINRQIGFSNVNKRASHPSKWLTATLNPFLAEIGGKQILPSPADWWQALCSPSGQQAVQYELMKWFNVNATDMPDDEDWTSELPGAHIMKNKQFKAAGALATQRSCAATQYLISDADTGFSNVQNCWAGRFAYSWVCKG